MNLKKMHKIQEERILNMALDAVVQTAELYGKIENYYTQANRMQIDASIVFRFGQRKFNYNAEIKSINSISNLGLIKMQFEKSKMSCLLVAPYITTEMAKYCRELGIQFIDTAGNV
ncbi:MAG: hypothetical protein KAJ48_10680 [Elusimicrobiales bacterium]|nr:hypothetical protein [Elusimicrobiales bacterium]